MGARHTLWYYCFIAAAMMTQSLVDHEKEPLQEALMTTAFFPMAM